MPFLGDSAIRHMGAVLAEIETLYRPSKSTPRCLLCRRKPGNPPRTSTRCTAGLMSEVASGSLTRRADSARMVVDRRYLIERAAIR